VGRKANQKKVRQERHGARLPVAPSASAPDSTSPGRASQAPSSRTPVQRAATPAVTTVLSPMARLLACLAVLFLVTTAAYWNSFDGVFILDDNDSIVNNSVIKPPVTFAGVMEEFRPLTIATFAWDWRRGDGEPRPFHSTNLALHLLCGLLLFFLGREVLRLPFFDGRYDPSVVDWIACAGAALFLVHPIQTESVTYIVQRAEAIGAITLVAILLILARFREPRQGLKAAALLIPIGVLGVFGKETVVVIPVLAVLFDICFLSRWNKAALFSRSKHFAAIGVVSLVAVGWVIRTLIYASSAGFQVENLTPATYLRAQITTVGYYFRLVFWPDAVCFDCGYFASWPVVNSMFGDSLLVWGGLLAVLVVSAFFAWRSYPLWTFAILGSAVVMAPTSTFMPLTDFYVEHRLYLPLGFLGLAVAAGFYDMTAWLAFRYESLDSKLRLIRVASAALVCALLCLVTIGRNELYADPISMWEDTLRQAPQNRRVQYTLGNNYGRAGRYEEAIDRYKQALILKPSVAKVHVNMGSTYNKMGRSEDAVGPFREAVRLDPRLMMARRNLARTLQRLGRLEEAEEVARAAVAASGSSSNKAVLRDILEARGGS
jgi:hypothetical protein